MLCHSPHFSTSTFNISELSTHSWPIFVAFMGTCKYWLEMATPQQHLRLIFHGFEVIGVVLFENAWIHSLNDWKSAAFPYRIKQNGISFYLCCTTDSWGFNEFMLCADCWRQSHVDDLQSILSYLESNRLAVSRVIKNLVIKFAPKLAGRHEKCYIRACENLQDK